MRTRPQLASEPSRPCSFGLHPPLTRHIQLHSERLGAGGGWHGAGGGGRRAGRGTRAAGGGRVGLGADVLLVGEVVILGDLPRLEEAQRISTVSCYITGQQQHNTQRCRAATRRQLPYRTVQRPVLGSRQYPAALMSSFWHLHLHSDESKVPCTSITAVERDQVNCLANQQPRMCWTNNPQAGNGSPPCPFLIPFSHSRSCSPRWA